MAAATSSSSAIIGSRPAISIAGQDQPSLAQGLLGLNVTETTAGLYRCEMVIGSRFVEAEGLTNSGWSSDGSKSITAPIPLW